MAFLSNSLQQQFDFLADTNPLGIATDLTTNAFVKTTSDLIVPANEGPQYWIFVIQVTFATAPGAATNPIELHLRPMNVVGTNDPVAPGGGTTAFTGHKVGDFQLADLNTAQYSKPLIIDFAKLQSAPQQTFEVYVNNTNTPTSTAANSELWAAPKTWGPKP